MSALCAWCTVQGRRLGGVSGDISAPWLWRVGVSPLLSIGCDAHVFTSSIVQARGERGASVPSAPAGRVAVGLCRVWLIWNLSVPTAGLPLHARRIQRLFRRPATAAAACGAGPAPGCRYPWSERLSAPRGVYAPRRRVALAARPRCACPHTRLAQPRPGVRRSRSARGACVACVVSCTREHVSQASILYSPPPPPPAINSSISSSTASSRASFAC